MRAASVGDAMAVIIDSPFRGSVALACGLVTRGRLAGRSFRRLYPDVYVPADLEVDLRVRSLAAYEFVRTGGGALAGYSAANLLGADCAPSGAPAEVLVRRKTRTFPGLIVCHGVAGADDLVEAGGCLTTTPVRTAWDLCRRLPLDEAVVSLDALSRVGRFDPSQLLERRAAQPGARNCRRLDDVVALADPRAESPPETRLRLALFRSGLPRPELQYEVIDEYGFVLARLDLAYAEAKLAIEYDGSTHFIRRQRERDLRRDRMLAAHGWLTLRFGPDDIGAAQTVGTIRECLAARGVGAGLTTDFYDTQEVS